MHLYVVYSGLQNKCNEKLLGPFNKAVGKMHYITSFSFNNTTSMQGLEIDTKLINVGPTYVYSGVQSRSYSADLIMSNFIEMRDLAVL